MQANRTLKNSSSRAKSVCLAPSSAFFAPSAPFSSAVPKSPSLASPLARHPHSLPSSLPFSLPAAVAYASPVPRKSTAPSYLLLALAHPRQTFFFPLASLSAALTLPFLFSLPPLSPPSLPGRAAEARKLAELGLTNLGVPHEASNYISDFGRAGAAPAQKGQEGGADFPGPLGGGGGGGIPGLLHASQAKLSQKRSGLPQKGEKSV